MSSTDGYLADESMAPARAQVSRQDQAEMALRRIRDRKAMVAVVGLGHAGLPLAVTIAQRAFGVIGFEIDEKRVEVLNHGQSYLSHVAASSISSLRKAGRLQATSDAAALSVADIVLICVPTPLDCDRQPDLSHVRSATETIARHLRAGQLVVLESTTLPGTTLNIVRPILERTGLKSGIDFYLSYSPEREDPGNLAFSVSTTPKIVGGDGRKALEIAMEFYACFVAQTVPVSSMEVAETAKLVENAFRAVNIALANEIKAACEAIGIDVWEVIDAAKSKPFGYMPFYPGPGTGGHCIPVDPVYLVSEAHARGAPLDLIETALRINAQMPERVVRGLDRALAASGRPRLRNAKILMVGLTYKKNVNDFRESPALRLIALMAQGGASVDYFDPHIESFVEDEHERRSIRWQADLLRRYDAAVIATDHDDVDYKMLADLVPVVLDTRNVMHRLGIRRTNVFQA